MAVWSKTCDDTMAGWLTLSKMYWPVGPMRITKTLPMDGT